ncbi:hypothetical protein [Arcobacter sp. LA11]|uniref:hypothetical protein n=1 Tax=Arcobacter sp. LA11 TaxID=1898176 RepID=UPI000932EC87|nr:hypothetical protein [Arcobacter sp. LA11]
MEISKLSISNSLNNISNKKTDTSEFINSKLFSNNLLNQINEDEKNEKMSNPDLLDGVTYNPYTDKYTLVLDDYGVNKSETKSLIVLDGSTKIISDKPITEEYLQERYEKIQYFFKTEFEDLHKQVDADNGILDGMGISMHGFSQRDSWGIVKIDGEYIDIDADEFQKHYEIYRTSMYEEETPVVDSYISELHASKLSFENAEEFEYYMNKKEWNGSHKNEIYRKISLAANLGLIEEGNQTHFSELYQTNKASYIFKNIENDILSQAVLDSIGEEYSGTMESIMYNVLFGTDDKYFQNKLNEFAKELKDNPSKYDSVNSDFTFTGNINFDENSTEEYKAFITNTLIDFIENQKSDYVDEDYSVDDSYRQDWSFAYSFNAIINNLKDSISRA